MNEKRTGRTSLLTKEYWEEQEENQGTDIMYLSLGFCVSFKNVGIVGFITGCMKEMR